MIQDVHPFVVTNQLDEPVWREFLAVPDVEANVFHTPEMVRVFESAARHRALPWAALDGRGRVRALLVPVEVTLRQGAMRFLTSRSVVYGGIARTADEAGSEAAAALLETYAASASRVTLFTEIRHLSDPAPLRYALASAGFRHEDHLNYLIPLADPGRDPWRGLTRAARKHVTRAERKGVTVTEETAPAAIDEAYRLLEAVYRRARVPLASRSLFEAAVAELVEPGLLHVFAARLDGEMIGARFVLTYRDRVMDWYAGSDRRFASFSPNELLVWHTLRWARERGFAVFDFGGAGRPGEPYGPRDFKAKFGGDLVDFGRDVLVHAPVRLRLSQAGYTTARRFRFEARARRNRTPVAEQDTGGH